MNTRKLYYEDCLLRSFCATVIDCQQRENGFAVTLDATAFYPEGGGQACDIGTLDESNVLFVKEEDEAVVHLCDKPLEVGKTVTGTIDWTRRFDLMQQHTGEHIVSGIIHRLFGGHNTGFHVGADTVTVDFDCPIPADRIPEIETLANEAVYLNLPVKCTVPSEEELSKIPYRTKRPLPWPVRLVEVPGYDTCACCGVHTAYTGGIGIIKLLSCIKFHQGVRMEMVCGARAFQYLSKVYEQNRQVSQAFSAKILETGAAAARMNEALAQEKFRAAGLEKQLFDAIGKEFAGKGNVVYFDDTLQPASVRALADAIAQHSGGTAAVFSGSDEKGYNLCLVNKTEDVRILGQEMAKALTGRGGGKDGFFQGSVNATKAQIQAFFHQ